MLRALALALVLSLALAVPAAARTVRVGDDWFVRKGDPPTVRVDKGTRVKWKWVGRDDHNVVVDRGPRIFESDLQDSGTFRKKMRRRGTYRIVCSIHQPDMRMTLKVR
jgi:plastocyanin